MTTDATRDLFARCQRRYARGYHVLSEVCVDGTRNGKFSRQSLDAVAIGLWRSTGHQVLGFEFKTNRADLLRELRSPEKALAGMSLVDRFWLVVPDLSVIQGTGRAKDLTPDLPAQWGILYSNGDSLRVKRQAAALPASGKPLDRRLVTAMVARATTCAFPVQPGTRRGRRRRR